MGFFLPFVSLCCLRNIILTSVAKNCHLETSSASLIFDKSCPWPPFLAHTHSVGSCDHHCIIILQRNSDFFSLLFKARHPRTICTPLRPSPQGQFSPLLSYRESFQSHRYRSLGKSVRTFSSISWDICQAFDTVLKFCPLPVFLSSRPGEIPFMSVASS